jgi:release factor glutamine methyltransferase
MGETRTWTVLDLIRWTTEHFRSRGIDSARLDAECLLAHALETERLQLYLEFDKPVAPRERAEFRELVKRRADERVPVALLTGRREFWSLPLRVTPDVLVPRPETETLVEVALQWLPDPESEARILDVGTGCGAIALALAKERPKARITATDTSAPALAVARENAAKLGFENRIRFLPGDGFEPVRGERFDLLVSNPPYLGESEASALPPEVTHEPREALFAGAGGTELLRRIALEARDLLDAGGVLAVEVDPRQAPEMTEWLVSAGFARPESHLDLAGRVRVVSARWGSERGPLREKAERVRTPSDKGQGNGQSRE